MVVLSTFTFNRLIGLEGPQELGWYREGCLAASLFFFPSPDSMPQRQLLNCSRLSCGGAKLRRDPSPPLPHPHATPPPPHPPTPAPILHPSPPPSLHSILWPCPPRSSIIMAPHYIYSVWKAEPSFSSQFTSVQYLSIGGRTNHTDVWC